MSASVEPWSRFGGLAANCSVLFTELPLLERAAAARAAGFEAVEFWWPFPEATPDRADVDRFVTGIEEAGVRLAALNFFAGDLAGGERGVLSTPGRSAELRASVEVAVAIGDRLGCRQFNALYGLRGEPWSPDEQQSVALDNLAFAARAVQDLGGRILVEPLSGCPDYPLRTAAEAMQVIGAARSLSGAPNIGMLADLYHLGSNGEDLAQVVARHLRDIFHVQVADAPGRHEPGSGHLALKAALDILVQGGYQGWVGLEYLPCTTTSESLAALSEDVVAACAPLATERQP